MIKVAPSVLAADFSKLADEVARVEASADYLHLDVMDGVFVPNISFGAGVIASLRPHSKLVFDVHLMISDPLRYIDEFVNAGADSITVHYESCEDPLSALKAIKAKGIRAGISIKPSTSANVLESLLEYVDMVLVMTVEPGFGGQSFMPQTLDSVRAVAQMINDKGLAVEIEVDGGISVKTIKKAYDAGARIFVAGSSVFKADDASLAIKELREACK